MRDWSPPIRGSGGGGKSGGGGGGISEDPDTLASVAFVRFVDLLGEGQIYGLVNGASSIYLDGVPLAYVDGTPNYKPFRWDFRPGTQDQEPIPMVPGSEQEASVGVKLTVAQGRIIRVIPDADANAVRVTVSVNGLTTTTEDGKIEGGAVQYRIYTRTQGGTWTLAKTDTISGKTQSRYQRAHEVPLTQLGAGPYEVGVERVTPDSTSALVVNDLYWDSFTTVNYEKFAYPNSTLAAVEIDARYFSSVPQRAYHVKGTLIRVPANYDPQKRTYATTGPGTTAGAWDGTFKVAYSNNPAWCYYDLCTNTRYGLGKRLGSSIPDKWTLYEIAKYCDELVPTGSNWNVFQQSSSGGFSSNGRTLASIPTTPGNMEPRFTLNCVLNTEGDAFKVLNQLTSVFRGMSYWSTGLVMLTQDRPTPVTMSYTNANVVDGRFVREGSGREQRNTVAIVGWNDPAEDFKQKFEYIEDREGIARYGVRPTEIIAFGCTSRGQARRVGLWTLYTQRTETETITFKVGLDSAFVEPGHVVEIIDNQRLGVRWGGRLISSTADGVTLDAPVTLSPGAYTLTIRQRNGDLRNLPVNIATAGTYTTLPCTVPFPPPPLSIWTLKGQTVDPLLARVVRIERDGDIGFTITALEHNPSKYDAIDRNAPLDIPDYTFLEPGAVAKVEGLLARENTYKPTVNSPPVINLDVSWQPIPNPLVRGYIVKVTSSGRTVKTLPESPETSVTVTGLNVGTYTVSVVGVNYLGIQGAQWATTTITITGKDSTPPGDVEGFRGTVDPQQGNKLWWNELQDYIDIYEIREGTSWNTAKPVASVKGDNWPLGAKPAGTYNYLIKARDTSRNYSRNAAATSIVVTGAAEPVVSYRIEGPDEVISWLPPSAPLPIVEYVIKYGNVLSTATELTRVKGTSLRRRVDYGGSRRYWIAAVDSAGGVGLAEALDVTITPPSGITAGRVEVVDNNALLFWKEPAEHTLPIAYYDIRSGTSYETGRDIGSNAASTFTTIFEQQSGTYRYWVLPVDTAGNQGEAVSITATINQPPDYVLRTSIDSTFSGTRTNMYIEAGKMIGPVVQQTWAGHFTTRGWDQPQDQIDAGYPIYAQPSAATGTYDETFDYGTVLPATTVTVTLGAAQVAPTVISTCQIYVKAAAADPWIAAPVGATSYLASNFRYVRVLYTFTCTPGTPLVRVDSLNVKLSSKLRVDSGEGFASASDSSGTLVNFNVPFVDASTPIVQPAASSPRFAVVNFLDAPNPTSFRVLLYDINGNRVSGDFSWTCRGY